MNAEDSRPWLHIDRKVTKGAERLDILNDYPQDNFGAAGLKKCLCVALMVLE